MFDKASPTLHGVPKGGFSWVTVDEAARSDDEPTEHGRAQPCVPEGGEYRTAQLLHRWAFRKSTSLLVYRHPHPIGVPFGGGSLQRWAIRRFVGQALLTLRLFKFAPFGDAAAHRCRSPHEKTLMTDWG